MTRSLCTTMNIAVVAAGSGQTSAKMGDNAGDPYQVPKEAGIFVSMDSGHAVTTSAIRERIVTNFKVTTAPPPRTPFHQLSALCWPPVSKQRVVDADQALQQRNASKEKAEQSYEEGKTYLAEHSAAK